MAPKPPAPINFNNNTTSSSNDYAEYDLSLADEGALLEIAAKGTNPNGPFASAPQGSVTALQVMQWFAKQSPQVIEEIQAQMIQAGILSPSNVVFGVVGATTKSAFEKSVILSAGSQDQYPLETYLSQAAAQGQYDIPLTKAEQTKPTAENVTYANPSDLANVYSQAYRDVNGELPSQAQINSFVTQYHQQQFSSAEQGVNAGKNLAEQDKLNATNTEANQLDTLSGLSLTDYTHIFMQQLSQPAYKGTQGVPIEGPPNPNAPGPLPVVGGTPGIKIDPVVWDKTVKELGLGNNYSVQSKASANIVQEVVQRAAHDAYSQYGNWTNVTTYLLTGKPNADLSAEGNKYVGSVISAMGALGSQQLSQASGGLISPTGQVQAPVVTTTTGTSSSQGEAVQAAETADPGRAIANSMADTYGSIVARMFRPGGFDSYTDPSATTGVDMPGGTAGQGGPALDSTVVANEGTPVAVGG